MNTFGEIKWLLVNRSSLKAPNFGQPSYFVVDARNKGIAAVLLQHNEDEYFYPVKYNSRNFNQFENSYLTIEKNKNFRANTKCPKFRNLSFISIHYRLYSP